MNEYEVLKNEVHSIGKMLTLVIEKLDRNEENEKLRQEAFLANRCSGRLLSEWLEEWLGVYKVRLKERSIQNIRSCIKNHILRSIEDKPLESVSSLDIQNALNSITASRTRKYTFDIFCASFRQALKLRLIAQDPMLCVERVRHKRKEGKALSISETRSFLEAISKDKKRDYYLFLLFSGCRKSEALSLRWQDINFEHRTIHILGTKSESSNRLIPLFSNIQALLLRQNRISERVFNYSANCIECDFKRLKKKYGFKFRLHDLRHTFATRCLENGVNLKIIQKWLGHSKLDITANIYTHVHSAFENSEVTKMENAFSNLDSCLKL